MELRRFGPSDLTDGFSLDGLAGDDFRRTHHFAELDLPRSGMRGP